jgi:hypothetical protein
MRWSLMGGADDRSTHYPATDARVTLRPLVASLSTAANPACFPCIFPFQHSYPSPRILPTPKSLIPFGTITPFHFYQHEIPCLDPLHSTKHGCRRHRPSFHNLSQRWRCSSAQRPHAACTSSRPVQGCQHPRQGPRSRLQSGGGSGQHPV